MFRPNYIKANIAFFHKIKNCKSEKELVKLVNKSKHSNLTALSRAIYHCIGGYCENVSEETKNILKSKNNKRIVKQLKKFFGSRRKIQHLKKNPFLLIKALEKIRSLIIPLTNFLW